MWPWARRAGWALLALGGLWLAWQLWQRARTPDDIAVVQVAAQPVARSIAVVGRVRPLDLVDIRPEVAGQVTLLLADEGDRVSAGAVLARLRADVEQAEVVASRADIAALQAEVEVARRTLARSSELAAGGWVTRQRLDDDRARLRRAEAQVAAARAGVDRAQARVRETVVRAPMAGTVLARPIDPGAVVGTSDVLFSLGSARGIEIEAEVDELYADAIRVGQTGVISPAGSSVRLAARVSEVSPRVDPRTGGRLVRLRPVGGDESLRPGRSVDTTIIVEQLSQALAVPRGALLRGPQGWQVLVLEGGRVVPRAIQKIDWPGTYAIVRSGLKAGDAVVLDPVSHPAGSRGRPVRAAAASLPAGAQPEKTG